MSALLVFVIGVVSVIGILVLVFGLGAKAGGAFWYQQFQRSRLEAARAERRLHDLTRDAFLAMAEHVERRGDQ